MALTRLPGSTTKAYLSIKQALRERFEPSNKQELYKAEFKSQRKQKSESWGDFADDLLRLVDRAFPTLQFKEKEQLALSLLLALSRPLFYQLEPMEASFGVKQRRPKTVHEAVSLTLELELYLAKPQSKSVSHIDLQKEPVVESIQAVQRDMMGTIQKLVKRMEKLEAAATQQRFPTIQTVGGSMPSNYGSVRQLSPGGQIICRCNQPGHYARGCATNIDQQGLGNWNQSSKLNVPNVPHVNINNVSSYFVVGSCLKLLYPT